MAVEQIDENSEPRKRPRIESSENDAKADEKPTPAYGSQEYWEKRYEIKDSAESGENEDDPEPYHAWYFKFDDLAPILLPLIVGTAEYEENCGEDDADNDENEDTDDDKAESSEETLPKTPDSTTNKHDDTNNTQNTETDEKVEESNEKSDGGEKDAASDNDEEGSDAGSYEGFEVIEMDEDDEDEADSETIRPGLAKKGPISVLEVGCGDAPLGQDLANSLQDYATKSGTDSSKIMDKIVCLDYSKNVIETMKKEQEQQSNKNSSPVVYEVGDARDLAYKNETFEVILEKGTLDAMLSDSDGVGQANCRKIVTECARVLTMGGYFIIISHLNAHVESGLDWLNNIVVPGLRACGNFEWLIEVHGSDVEIPSDDEGEEKEIESPGPAVYFIEKVGHLSKEHAEKSNDEKPTIPLKFFSY